MGQEGKLEYKGMEINVGPKHARNHGNEESCPDLPEDMGWQPIDQLSASDQVVFMTHTAIDRLNFLAHVKQEG